jgi:gluconokinase
MLRSQFDTLVEPANAEALHIDIAQSVEQVLQQALTAIEARSL